MRTEEYINYTVTRQEHRSIYRLTCDSCGAEAVWDTGDPNDGHVAFRDSAARDWIIVGRGPFSLKSIAEFCSVACLQDGVASWKELPPEQST